jgi:signal transduction histidine kinase
MRARLAWGVFAVTTIAVILDTVFTAAHRGLLSEATWAAHGWPLAPLAGVGCALMGALIVSHHPKHMLGWLLCVASLLSVTLAADAYTQWVLEGDGPGSAHWAHVIGWASPLLGWPAFAALVMVFLISPSGHLASPRWRWAVWATLAGLGLRTLGQLTMRPGDFVFADQYDGSSVSTVLLTMGYLLVAAGLIASAVALVLRLRQARDDERRQLLWIAASAVFLAIGVVVILVVPRIEGEEGTWLAGLPLRLAQLSVPLCVAVAVLRHRLLEIDLIVNRALMVALATGLAAIGYVSLVVVVGSTVGGAGGFWPSLLATALVAMAFQPLRHRVVRLADRLAFGAAAEPYEALADFSRQLEDRPDPAALLPAMAEAAARAVNAARAVVSLHVEAGTDEVVSWPPLGHEDEDSSRVAIPVVDHGKRLGTITVAMTAGHALRPRDQRLLEDLADQAAMAFRNAQLTAELAAEVQRLNARNRELDQSRSRLISAGDAERSRVERAIARQVIPHLAPLPGRLRQLSLSDPALRPSAPDSMRLEPLLASMNRAVESLREITRGVFPAQLARSGLPTALGSLLARPGLTEPHRLTVEDSAAGRRFNPRVEAATYFCVAEATRAFENPVSVLLSVHGDQLHLSVGGTDHGGLSLSHMRDRMEAAGGSVSTTCRDGQTTVEVRASSARAAMS